MLAPASTVPNAAMLGLPLRVLSWADALDEELEDPSSDVVISCPDPRQVADVGQQESDHGNTPNLGAQAPDELLKAVAALQEIASSLSSTSEMLSSAVSRLACRCQVLEHWLCGSLGYMSCSLHHIPYVTQCEPTPQFVWNPEAPSFDASAASVAGSAAAVTICIDSCIASEDPQPTVVTAAPEAGSAAADTALSESCIVSDALQAIDSAAPGAGSAAADEARHVTNMDPVVYLVVDSAAPEAGFAAADSALSPSCFVSYAPQAIDSAAPGAGSAAADEARNVTNMAPVVSLVVDSAAPVAGSAAASTLFDKFGPGSTFFACTAEIIGALIGEVVAETMAATAIECIKESTDTSEPQLEAPVFEHCAMVHLHSLSKTTMNGLLGAVLGPAPEAPVRLSVHVSAASSPPSSRYSRGQKKKMSWCFAGVSGSLSTMTGLLLLGAAFPRKMNIARTPVSRSFK